METGRLPAWKVNVDTGANGFHFRLKITNARGWLFQNKSRLFRMSFRANLHGALLRIKVSANKVLSRCEDQQLKWKNVKGFGEFRFRNIFFRSKASWAEAKDKRNQRTNAYRQSKSHIPSYSQFLKSIIFTSKKTDDSENMNDYSSREFCEARWGQLPSVLLDISGGISGWIAMILFMWSPVSQLNKIIRNPANLPRLSVFTILLALIGNGVLIPRALFIRDQMWSIGSSWGSSVQGLGILLSMYIDKATNSVLFWGVICGFLFWLGANAIKDMHAHSLTKPVAPYLELLKGKRKYEGKKKYETSK